MATSTIEWTERVWNPLTGCDKVSPGCTHCYAEVMAKRLRAMGQPAYRDVIDDRGRWTGAITLVPEKLPEPLTRRTPTRYFVNSMSDLFHKNVPDEYIDKVFAVMALAPQHTFQILTKRPERMHAYMQGRDISNAANFIHDRHIESLEQALYFEGEIELPLKNVWLGVSVENQETADERIPYLTKTLAQVWWVSYEPALGAVDFSRWRCLDWIVAGGESGRRVRGPQADWFRAVRDHCKDCGTAFFFKQWGGMTPKAQGRVLDGRTHDEYPFDQLSAPCP